MATTRKKATLKVGIASGSLLAAGIFVAPAAEARPSVCNYGRVICANKATRQIAFVVNGQTKLVLDARYGSTLRNLQTRNGMHRVYWKNRWHVSSIYGQDMPFSLFFSGGQAIHYSANFARVGYRERSHGCVNLRSYSGAQRLFEMVRTGDRVYVHNG
ncbi:MAG: L,D-transpeptidase [Sporichthyaceae bacterium]